MKLNTHQINSTYKHYIKIRDWINTRRKMFSSWKRSNFFTSLTNKLQESRFFHRFANSPFATKRWKESIFLQPKQRKTIGKKSLLVFLIVENHPAFAVLFVGKNVLFSLCKLQPWKSCCVLLGVVWCPGLAEAPMPGSLSRGTGQGEGGLHREALPEEMFQSGLFWKNGSETEVVRVPLNSLI